MAQPQRDHRETFDLLIIGGGISGVGIARDAAGRGLSVILCEQDDIGGPTTLAALTLHQSRISMRELFRFRAGTESLAEQEILLAAAPHIVRPVRVVAPYGDSLRTAWMMRFGRFLQGRLSRRMAHTTAERVDLREHPVGNALQARLRTGVVYPDCWIDVNRLAVLNALDARSRGAEILTNCRCVEARREAGGWRVTLEDTLAGERREVAVRALVYAARQSAGEVARDVLGLPSRRPSRLVKDIQIVVPRLDPAPDDPASPRCAYSLLGANRRTVSVLPFESDFSLVGTTDVPFEGDSSDIGASEEEIHHLCDAVNRYFDRGIDPADVLRTFSEVRWKHMRGSIFARRTSRNYGIEMHVGPAPAITVWDADLTSYRRLAEAAIDQLHGAFPGLGDAWTAGASLPGGKLSPTGMDRFERMVESLWSWLPTDVALGYAGRYGSRIHNLMGNASSMEEMGRELSPGFYEREARFLVRDEWARTVDDLLWCRTKHGLYATADDVDNVNRWLDEHRAHQTLANDRLRSTEG